MLVLGLYENNSLLHMIGARLRRRNIIDANFTISRYPDKLDVWLEDTGHTLYLAAASTER
jgi:hypothetical protein